MSPPVAPPESIRYKHYDMSDFKLAIRALLKTPGFAAVAVIALALGIGANTAIFSVIDAVMLRATPYPNADRIVRINESGKIGDRMSVSPLNFNDWERANTSFERMAIYRSDEFTVSGVEVPFRGIGAIVSANLFPMLSATPELGRTISSSDDRLGAPMVAVISHAFWESHFGSDPRIAGHALQLDGSVYTIVGVMPPSFDFPEHTEFWIAANPFFSDNTKFWTDRSNHGGQALALLKSGMGIEQASANLKSIANDLQQKYPESNQGQSVVLRPWHDDTVSDVRPALLAVLASVAFVLLIACANVANLLLARALQRKKDIALRVALGASRGRVVRQMLVESLILSMAGGACGVLFADWGTSGLVKLVHNALPYAENVHVNLPVLVFTLAVALVTGFLAGVLPSLQATRIDLNSALKESTRSATGGVDRRRTRGILVVAEIALSFVLLASAVLMVRTFSHLMGVNLGIQPDHTITMRLSLPPGPYPVEQLLRKVRGVPGVVSAGVVTPNPLDIAAGGWETVFVQPGEPKRSMADVSWTHRADISPGYLESLHVPLLAGRYFDDRDGLKGREGVIVDDLFVQRHWPHENPIGKRLKFGFDPGYDTPWRQVVGVVGHIRNFGADYNWTKDPIVEIFVPAMRDVHGGWTVVARTIPDPSTMAKPVEDAVRSFDGRLAISEPKTMDEWVASTLQKRRFAMLLLLIFSGLGLTLAIVGVYAVMAYSVTQRSHEIGVRVALGAGRAEVFRLVTANAGMLAAAGIGAGILATLALARLLSQIVVGVSPTDPGVLALVAAVLVATTLAASLLPARRATLVDPITALREE